MKYVLLIFFTACAVASDIDKWNDFKIKFNKKYSTAKEEAVRFSIFQDNLRKIEEHNVKFLNGVTKHKMGVTRFADISEEEFFDKSDLKKQKLLKFNRSYAQQKPVGGYCYYSAAEPKVINSLPHNDNPSSRDFRDDGVVTEPRDMGDKTVDYAFAIAGTLEIALALGNGTLEYLSPQYLIDCSNEVYDGYYRAVINGLPRDIDYPLTEEKGDCRELCTGVCFGYTILAHESIIENVVAYGRPVSIWFDGGDLALYESGIIDGSNCYYNPEEWFPDESKWRKPWNVVVVGYGTENGTDYWILKNSWGTSWGEGGYFRLIRGTLACGIERLPVAPETENGHFGACDH